MKRFALAVLAVMLVLPRLPARAEEGKAAAMILYEPRTGTVLEARNPDDPMLIASTTKIMTALVVLEHCGLDETVTVADEQTEIEGSSASLKAGETYTVEELLYALMLASGNDAALALAEHTAGSTARFAAMMNEKAGALGLGHTHFMNPHGLDDPEHFSTARDLALLTAEAMKNEAFCRLFAARSFRAHGREYRNHNKLLDSCEGCLGGKTGYTRAAGRTLVSCAERDGLRLICVTLADPNDWEDHRRCYEEAFAAYRYEALPAERWKQLPVISGVDSCAALDCGVSGILLHRSTEVAIRVELPQFLFAPVRAGEGVGRITVYENGTILLDGEIVAAASVALDEAERRSPWSRLQSRLAKRCAVILYSEDLIV